MSIFHSDPDEFDRALNDARQEKQEQPPTDSSSPENGTGTRPTETLPTNESIRPQWVPQDEGHSPPLAKLFPAWIPPWVIWVIVGVGVIGFLAGLVSVAVGRAPIGLALVQVGFFCWGLMCLVTGVQYAGHAQSYRTGEGGTNYLKPRFALGWSARVTGLICAILPLAGVAMAWPDLFAASRDRYFDNALPMAAADLVYIAIYALSSWFFGRRYDAFGEAIEE